MSRSGCARAALVLGVVFSFSGLASAQEVRWRHDYSAARKESQQTGRPLVLDFGTEACSWCKKLDATTFRARPVVEMMNGRFIPVKVDADRAMPLVQALGIQSYPTLIVAAPDGAILGRQEGFVEAGAMLGVLERALAKMPRPTAVAPASAVVPANHAVVQAAAGLAQPAGGSVRPAGGAADPAREEIARKLSQVYLERGAELCRLGKGVEGGEYLGLAATLCPRSPEAVTAREMLRQLQSSEGPTRP